MKLSSTEDRTQTARNMGEEFAKARSTGLLEIFLKDSNIGAEFYEKYLANLSPHSKALSPEEHIDLLKIDFKHAFGQVTALCYALGYLDAADKVPTDLYKKSNQLDIREAKANSPQQAGEPTQLILPGFNE